MTTEHKLLIGAGAVIIVTMLLIAAFSLGVYVGEYGLTRDGLTLREPSGPDKPFSGDPGGKPPLPGADRPPDVTGRIRETFEDTLLLATPDGPRTVELDERTQVKTLEGDERSPDDLEPGQRVAVFGRRNSDGKALIAELVVLLPLPQGPPDPPLPHQP